MNVEDSRPQERLTELFNGQRRTYKEVSLLHKRIGAIVGEPLEFPVLQENLSLSECLTIELLVYRIASQSVLMLPGIQVKAIERVFKNQISRTVGS